MASRNQQFFALKKYAVVSNTDLQPFPGELYEELQDLDKKVYPIDMGGSRYVKGDEAFPTLLELPEKVEAVIVALPRHNVTEVVAHMVELGLARLWLQCNPSLEVLAACKKEGIEVHQADARAG